MMTSFFISALTPLGADARPRREKEAPSQQTSSADTSARAQTARLRAENFDINYDIYRKDPLLAFEMSLALGFGTSHFYAGETTRGLIVLAGELIGAGLYASSYAVDADNDLGRNILAIGGAVLFSGFRLADILMAPSSVARHNKSIARKLGIAPLIRTPKRSVEREEQQNQDDWSGFSY